MPTPSRTLWVLNGPNLNLLGTREPEIYGRATLPEIERALGDEARARNASVLCFQSNDEGALVTRIQEARGVADGILINAGAYSHSSVAIHDALLGVGLPAIEVHLSNVHRRESFRHRLVTARACLGVVAGLGPIGYTLALIALLAHLDGLDGKTVAAQVPTSPIPVPAPAPV